MRLLLIEDDAKIAAFVAKGMREAGYAVDRAADGEDGLHLALTEDYDLCIVDIMLPGLDGVSLVERVRAKGKTVPILFLSAKHTVDDRVRGLQAGGDDYLVKPFAFPELLARVQSLLRRSGGGASPTTLSCADIEINLLTREVFRGGTRIDLQPREFALLEYLMRQPGRVVSKTMILEHIWDYHFDPQTNVVDVLVCRLRNKIDKDFEAKRIGTLRGVGYVLKTDRQ